MLRAALSTLFYSMICIHMHILIGAVAIEGSKKEGEWVIVPSPIDRQNYMGGMWYVYITTALPTASFKKK
jgi:hypothetical protein